MTIAPIIVIQADKGGVLILDATIIRMVLVPASMESLGGRNWYFPSWLKWIPEVSIEDPSADAADGGGALPAPALEAE